MITTLTQSRMVRTQITVRVCSQPQAEEQDSSSTYTHQKHSTCTQEQKITCAHIPSYWFACVRLHKHRGTWLRRSRAPSIAGRATPGWCPVSRDEHLPCRKSMYPHCSRYARWSRVRIEPTRGDARAPLPARARWGAKPGLEHVPCAQSAQQEQRPRSARSTSESAAQLAGTPARPRILPRRALAAEHRRLQARHGAFGGLS